MRIGDENFQLFTELVFSHYILQQVLLIKTTGIEEQCEDIQMFIQTFTGLRAK